jgi:hypothetical protein
MSVRLDPETAAMIRRMARMAGRSKSWVVREAIAAYAAGGPLPARRPFDTLAPFMGAGETGRRDLSEHTGEQFTRLVQRKARARHAR